uniref:Uncharacterized protein n=1 Tax=Rhipicephalus pulchellus TaxID=72859 RepID=L7LVH0_RHIPC
MYLYFTRRIYFPFDTTLSAKYLFVGIIFLSLCSCSAGHVTPTKNYTQTRTIRGVVAPFWPCVMSCASNRSIHNSTFPTPFQQVRGISL